MNSLRETGADAEGAGVYILVNDGVYEWASACLASLRHYSPQVPIYLIPFDSQHERVRTLGGRMGCGWYDSHLNPWLDGWGRRLFPQASRGDFYPIGFFDHIFRKFSVFWGPLDEFIFLDADTLALTDVMPLLAKGKDFGDTSFGDTSLGDVSFGDMDDNEANSGVFFSRRDALTPADFEAAFQAAEAQGSRLPSEQRLLTECIDRAGLRKTRLADALGCSDSVWAGLPVGGTQDSGFWRSDKAEGNALPFLHWAGWKQPDDIPHKATWNHFYQLGLVQFPHCPDPPAARETVSDVTLCTVAFSAVDALALMWRSFNLYHETPILLGCDHGSRDGADVYLAGIANHCRQVLHEEHGGGLDGLCREVRTPYTMIVDTDIEFLGPVVAEMRALLEAGHFCATIAIDHNHDGSATDVGNGVMLVSQSRLSPCCALFRTDQLQELLQSSSFRTHRDEAEGTFYDCGSVLYRDALARGLSVAAVEAPHEKMRHYGAISSLFFDNPPDDPDQQERYAAIGRRLAELGGPL